MTYEVNVIDEAPIDVSVADVMVVKTPPVMIRGEKGEPGGVFIPAVENGMLTWSNNAGLPNPAPYPLPQPLSEIIELDKSYWMQNGYPYTMPISFRHRYNQPKVYVQISHTTLSPTPYSANLCNLDGGQVSLRTNVPFANIGVSVFFTLFVTEGGI